MAKQTLSVWLVCNNHVWLSSSWEKAITKSRVQPAWWSHYRLPSAQGAWWSHYHLELKDRNMVACTTKSAYMSNGLTWQSVLHQCVFSYDMLTFLFWLSVWRRVFQKLPSKSLEIDIGWWENEDHKKQWFFTSSFPLNLSIPVDLATNQWSILKLSPNLKLRC